MKTTTDMYFAAVLLSYGANLARVDKRDRKRQQFVFDGHISHVFMIDNEVCTKIVSPGFDKVEELYIAKKLLLLPSYPNSVKDMKSAIHSKAYVL